MPADRLALAVGISREDQAVGLPGLVGGRLELLRLVAIGLPFPGEALVGIDRPALGRQVAALAVRGQGPISPAQIFFRGFALGPQFERVQLLLGSNCPSFVYAEVGWGGTPTTRS